MIPLEKTFAIKLVQENKIKKFFFGKYQITNCKKE
jgi:hypothetical protein